MPILSQLPIKARESYGFKDIRYPLISVAKLCDANCKVIFEKEKLTIIHKNKIIAQPNRDFISKLWTLPLNSLNECYNKQDKKYGMSATN